MDATELARWTRFAAKGGIGKCTAIVDCIAREMGEDLMFLKDDEITVLMQLPEHGVYLGHCEGVVGRFAGKDVRFHGKLKKPVMAKRGSVTVGATRSDSRVSISLVDGSRLELPADRSRYTPESPSTPGSESRAKRTPSPSYPKSHAHMQSYATSYSRYSEDQTPNSCTTMANTLHTPPVKDLRCPSGTKCGHAKSPQMVSSTSGASVFSIASVYSEASNATDDAFERTRSRNGSIYSTGSDETEKVVPGVPHHGNVDQANGLSGSHKPASSSVSISNVLPSTTPSVSVSASNTIFSALGSKSTSISESTSDTSFASTPTHGSASATGSSVGSISELETKQFDMSKFGILAGTQANFVLAPPPLKMGGDTKGSTSPVVAPLRVSKTPKLSPSPGLPPSSPLPVPPTASGEVLRAASVSAVLSSPLSPGKPNSFLPRPPISPSLGFPASLSPGLPGSLTPGQRSPGLPGSLSPGFRFGKTHGPDAHSQYVFSSGSGSNIPNPYPTPTLTSPYPEHNAPTSPNGRTPSSPHGTGSAPISPPPTSPLPPLPATALPSPAFPSVSLPSPSVAVGSTMGTAATAAANGRMSPLTVLSSSLPSPTPGTLYADDLRRRNGNGNVIADGHGDRDGAWADVEEGDKTRLSTLDAFCRRLDEEAETSEDEGERILGLVKKGGDEASRESGNEKMRDIKMGKEDEDVHSDGEVGIGLSLMGGLDSDEDEDSEDDARRAKTDRRSGSNGNTTALAWTRYTPTSPVSVKNPNRYHRTGEGEGGDGGEEDEDEEDEGAYWDDIYDDYRYSRYSMGSKHLSITSKASGVSKTSSKARANAPPMPIPLDRPSLESTSSAKSVSIPSSRPSLTRSASDDSTHAMHTLPLTAQFPAVPVYVPVRTESRLRIVHDGYTQGGDNHGERELQVVHGSTEESVGEVGLNIEVVEVAEEDDGGRGREVDVRSLRLTSSNANNANVTLSPLLHTTFGSPHSSRFTDFEDGSDQDHLRRYSNRSGQSTLSSIEGQLKSQADGGGMASPLRERMDAADHAVSSDPSNSFLVTPVAAVGSSSSEEPGLHADDSSRQVTGINITVNGSVLATEVTSPLLTSPTQSTNAAEKMVTTDPARLEGATPVGSSEDAEKSTFLRPRPQPSGDSPPHPFARTSMFLPHPNAPKVVQQTPSPGPMYGRMTAQAYAYPSSTRQFPGTPPGTTFFSMHILHQLRSLYVGAPLPQGSTRRFPMTLFARCQPELSASTGPVPILFSLDPFPVMSPEHTQTRVAGGGGRRVPHPVNMAPTRAATVSVPVRRGGDGVPLVEGMSAGGDPGTVPRRSATTVSGAGVQQDNDVSPPSSAPSMPIPRERFVPQVGAARPRSRSFSSFGAHVAVGASQDRSREEPATIKMQGVASVTAGPPRNAAPVPSVLMARHAPSPLVLQVNNKDREPDGHNLDSPAIKSSSALTTQFKVAITPEPLTHSPQSVDALRISTENGALASPAVSSPFASSLDRDKDVSPLSGLSGMTSGTSVSSLDPAASSQPHGLAPGRHGSLDTPSSPSARNGSNERPLRKSSDSTDSRSLASPPPIPEATLASQSARPSPLTQDFPLKTKLSLPALRIKGNSTRSNNSSNKLDDAISIASMAVSGENETVQVQDMDFELVKPSIPQVAPGRASQDSTMTGRDVDAAGKPEASPILGDGASMVSSAPKSPLVPTSATSPPPTESAESIDAHRQRELRWMGLFPAIPPSQARKNKKVRKLLQEGVPSSVRYLVWCHLTDSKARALPGVYAKLCKRPPVPAFAEIEKDAVEGFPDQPQLHTAQGPLVSLLQAYLSMVPDIQYSSGLTLIAGHLLLLAPEEDAFWIFASMMDAHLRTYFATNAVQVEIDATLFSKALEVIDPTLTKKLYMQLSIAPASITRPWFSTLFVGSLSVDHLHRVWDIFLYDGIPYLFRIGLVVVNCVRHLLLQATTEEAALAHLAHPPPACLPSAADLLVLAANVKLKDDDVRKQRIKMEQQLKRTTQARPPNGLSSVQTTAISRPRT